MIRLSQYSRRFHLEVSTHNKSLKQNDQLPETLATLMSKTTTHVSPNDLDVCHLIGAKEKGRAIMELTNRKLRWNIILNRKNLKNVDLPDHGKIYINEALCPEYKKLSYTCRRLCDDKKIHRTWFFNGRLWVIEIEDGDKQPIAHVQDLYDLVGVETVDEHYKK